MHAFPVLDWLFGTFFLPSKRWPDRYGVQDNDVPEGFLAQLVYPFLPSRRQPSSAPVEPKIEL